MKSLLHLFHRGEAYLSASGGFNWGVAYLTGVALNKKEKAQPLGELAGLDC
jgi:hypothetical protein